MFFQRKILTITAVLLLLFACSMPPITVEKFTQLADVEEGENATIAWKFNNADKVTFNGQEQDFLIDDSVSFKALEPKIYTVIAYQGDSDSLVMNCVVNVKEKAKTVQRGPILLKQENLSYSYQKSEYLKGILETTKLTEPTYLKAMRILYPFNNNTINVRTNILDEFGNYLKGYSDIANEVTWRVEKACNSKVNSQKMKQFIEKSYDNNSNLDIGIALDVSAASIDGDGVVEQIKEMFDYLSPDDNVMFSTYNQNYYQIFALEPAEKALFEFENMQLSEPDGLNALNKSIIYSIDRLKDGFNSEKILILIAYNSDNSSIVYDAHHAVKRANQENIPIYVIGIGAAIESYNLRYIASASGGRFYHIFDDEVDNLNNILNEIIFAQKAFYEIEITLNNDEMSCNQVNSHISFANYDTNIKENIKLVIKNLPQYMKYQALVNFDYQSIGINSKYHVILKSIPPLLIDNPNVAIELIGHSSMEGSERDNEEIAFARAEAVKKFLIKQGVPEEQIKTRGLGYHQPIYFLQSNKWQQKYNRRVELKWLDPTVMPYEIATGILKTEDDALREINLWENRGYQVYYDRWLSNNTPSYKVKLWGYSTVDEANKAVRELKKRFKKEFTVE